MKNIIILTFILIISISNVFGQENIKTLRKHPFAVDFGLTYSHVRKNHNYYRPDSLRMVIGEKRVTRNPGRYSHSTVAIHAEINKNFQFHKFFYFRIGLTFYNDKNKHSTPLDTIKKYYRYPDSIKNQLPFEQANWPLNFTTSSNSIKLTLALLFEYKRLNLVLGTRISLVHFYHYNGFYPENKKYRFIDISFLSQRSSFLELYGTFQFKIFKTIPLYCYISINENNLFGLEYKF